MNALFTRHRAEAWRAANPTPAPEQLAAFLDNEPRPLPFPTKTHLSDSAVRLALYLLGATLLGLVGTLHALL
jgi:hypothetical protein